MKNRTGLKNLLIREEDLICMLHHEWLLGFIICATSDDFDDAEKAPIPMDGDGGPQTTEWIKKKIEQIGKMRKRKDGTVYLPKKSSCN